MSKSIEEMLAQNAYKPVPAPLRVAGVDFGFDAALVGPGEYGNLVVVVTDDDADSASVVRRVRSLMLVLSRTNSARPVTVVLVTSGATESVNALADLAHVVTIPVGADENEALRRLKPLLKLEVPDPISPISTELVFSEALGPLQSDLSSKAMISAARHGATEVEKTLLRLAKEALQGPASGDQND